MRRRPMTAALPKDGLHQYDVVANLLLQRIHGGPPRAPAPFLSLELDLDERVAVDTDSPKIIVSRVDQGHRW